MYSPSRAIQLDLLRALAIFLVLGRHMYPLSEKTWQPILFLCKLWQRCGWIGVDLFFVVSGFLVSGLLFNEFLQHGRIELGRFYIRRGFKIYPAFYLLILVTILVLPRLGGHVNWAEFLHEVFFVQNYWPGLWSHTWSLAVEEHFYLILPLLLFYLVKTGSSLENPFGIVPKIFVLFAAGMLLYRFIGAAKVPFYSHRQHLYPTHLRLDSLLFGVLLSYYYHFRRIFLQNWFLRNRLLLGCAAAACLIPAFVLRLEASAFVYTAGLSLLYLGFGVLLILTLTYQGRAPRISHQLASSIAAIGAHSYSIYLWHIPVRIWGMDFLNSTLRLDRATLPAFVVYFFGSIFVGIAMAILIEFPILKLRDRVFPSRSKFLLKS